jgi:hypothetical protein
VGVVSESSVGHSNSGSSRVWWWVEAVQIDEVVAVVLFPGKAAAMFWWRWWA